MVHYFARIETMLYSVVRGAAAIVGLAFLVAGCRESAGPAVDTNVRLRVVFPQSPQLPVGRVGDLLADSIVVYVETLDGVPVAGRRVGSRIDSPVNGHLIPAAATSGPNGRLVFQWQLGTTSLGQIQHVVRLAPDGTSLGPDWTLHARTYPRDAIRFAETDDTLSFFVGDTLTASMRDEFGNEAQVGPGSALTFASDQPDVATVDAAGLISARQPGTAQLTVSQGGVITTKTLVVHPLRASWYPLFQPVFGNGSRVDGLGVSGSRVVGRAGWLGGSAWHRPNRATASWVVEVGAPPSSSNMLVSTGGAAWITTGTGMWRSPTPDNWERFAVPVSVGAVGGYPIAVADTFALVRVVNKLYIASRSDWRLLPDTVASLDYPRYAIAADQVFYRARWISALARWELATLVGDRWVPIDSISGAASSSGLIVRPRYPEALFNIGESSSRTPYRVTQNGTFPITGLRGEVSSDGMGNLVSRELQSFHRSANPAGSYRVPPRHTITGMWPGPGRAIWLRLMRARKDGFGGEYLVLVEPL